MLCFLHCVQMLQKAHIGNLHLNPSIVLFLCTAFCQIICFQVWCACLTALIRDENMYIPRTKGIVREQKILHNKEAYSLYSLPDIISVIKWRMRGGHEGGRMTPRWVLRKWDGRLWSGFNWLRMKFSMGCYKQSNDLVVSIKMAGIFLSN